jgi:ABC-2 type transport system permease protein
MDVLVSFAAEWFKVRKRPAVWVLGGVMVGLIASLDYILPLLALVSVPKGTELGGGVTFESLRQLVYPAHFVQTTLRGLTSLGNAVALILGVLACGSEYGWSTLNTLFTQRPGRLAAFAGKLAAMAVVLGIYVVLVFLVDASLAAAIGSGFGAPFSWPTAANIAQAALAGWLVMGLWASVGILLAISFRQSGLAIGLGLVYSVAVEGIVFGTLRQVSWIQDVERAFPGANAIALAEAFGSPVRVAVPVVNATQATLVVAAYILVFCVAAGALLRWRDIG